VFDSIENATQLDIEEEAGSRPRRAQSVVPCTATLMMIE
jgi:hypothetical protein